MGSGYIHVIRNTYELRLSTRFDKLPLRVDEQKGGS